MPRLFRFVLGRPLPVYTNHTLETSPFLRGLEHAPRVEDSIGAYFIAAVLALFGFDDCASKLGDLIKEPSLSLLHEVFDAKFNWQDRAGLRAVGSEL